MTAIGALVTDLNEHGPHKSSSSSSSSSSVFRPRSLSLSHSALSSLSHPIKESYQIQPQVVPLDASRLPPNLGAIARWILT